MLIFPQCFILVYQKKVCRFSCCEITLKNWLNFLCFLIKALLNPLINNSKIIINYISLFWISLLPIFPFLKGSQVFIWMQDSLLNLSIVKTGVQPQNLFFSLFPLPFYTWIIFCFGWFTVSLSALMYFEKFLLNFSAFSRLLIKDITDVPPCHSVCHALLSVLFFFLTFLIWTKEGMQILIFHLNPPLPGSRMRGIHFTGLLEENPSLQNREVWETVFWRKSSFWGQLLPWNGTAPLTVLPHTEK